MFARLVLWILLALFAVVGTLFTILFASAHDPSDEFPSKLRDMHVGADGAFACTMHLSDHTLRLMLVGADGKTRFDSQLAYESAYADGACYPLSLGVLVDSEGERVIFRVAHLEDSDPVEEWRAVRWSTGELISSVRPTPPLDRSQSYCLLGLVKPVVGTPLLACYWTEISSKDSPRGAARGASFIVTDLDAKSIWELDLPHDYEAAGVEREADRLWRWARTSDAVLTCNAPNRFEIVLAANAQRATFEVRADAYTPTGWAVREVAREAYSIDLDEHER